jgi:hypothetical protein
MEYPSPPEAFSEFPFYSTHFMDMAIWEPFVRLVSSRHGYLCRHTSSGLPGTYPTFIAEIIDPLDHHARNAIVVKFFGPLFDGIAAFEVECAMGHYLSGQPISIGSPAILAEGRLNQAWSYIIFSYVPGKSYGEVRAELPKRAKEAVAKQMGRFMRELHVLTAARHPVIPQFDVSWKGYVDFLDSQRESCLFHHQQWEDLPPALLEQLPGFIPPLDQLVDLSAPPHLIHADLTADHLLGRRALASQTRIIQGEEIAMDTPASNSVGMASSEGWECMAIIDWGDSRVGDILYELVAVHVDVFQGDKHLLRLCLESYKIPGFYQLDFARKAMSMVLLHQFPVPASSYAPFQSTQSLSELAEGLFGIW